jgi:phosphoesterase RecJ-like protein
MKNRYTEINRPPLRKKLKKFYKLILGSRAVIITGHVTPDGDDIASQLALAEFLENRGRNYIIAWCEDVPGSFKFLPGSNKIVNINKNKIDPMDYDLFIVVDCGDISRIGDVKSLIKEHHIIVNIDHHQSNTMFGKFNIVEEKACSIGEILYYFFLQNRIPISYKMAVDLYVSLVTDTGSFNYDCMHRDVYLIAADLIDLGIIPSDFNVTLFQNKSLAYMELLTRVLTRMELLEDSKIAISNLRYEDFTEVKDDYTDGIIEYLGIIESVSVYILIKEKERGVFSASMRSKYDVDVAGIASGLNGGGHMRAAGCSTDKMSYDEFKEEIIRKIKQQFREHNKD